MKFKILLTLLIILTISPIAYSGDFYNNMLDRAIVVNEKQVIYDSSLNNNQVMTYQQAQNRVSSVFNYSNEFYNDYVRKVTEDYDRGDMLDIKPENVIIDIIALIEIETRWVNYSELDNGISAGVPSMRLSTAKEVANKLDEEWNETQYRTNPTKQIKYMVRYYYHLLYHQDGDRYKAMLSYNTGLNGSTKGSQWRDYYFQAKGRSVYLEDKYLKE